MDEDKAKVTFSRDNAPHLEEDEILTFSVHESYESTSALLAGSSKGVSVNSFAVQESETVVSDLQSRSTIASVRLFYTHSQRSENESLDRNASWLLTVFSLLGMYQGSTFLAIPFVVARGGILILLSIVPIGVLTYHTSLLLIDCQYDRSSSSPKEAKRLHHTYIDIGKAALPKRIGGKVMTILTLSSLFTDIYVFILTGQATQDLLHDYLPLQNIHYSLFWGAVLLPLLFVTRMSVLAWFCSASLFLFTIVTGLIYFFLFWNTASFDLANLAQPFSTKYFFIGYGIVLNSFNIHWLVPAVEGSMKTPKYVNSAFATPTGISIFIKISASFLCVLLLGRTVQQSITSNLFTSKVISLIANISLLATVYLYLPVGMFVVYEMFDLYFLPHFILFSNRGLSFFVWRLMSRLLVLLSVLFFAVSVPQFGLVVGVIGSFRGTLVAIVIPIYCHLVLKWNLLSLYRKGLELSLVVISVICSIGGTYYSCRELIG